MCFLVIFVVPVLAQDDEKQRYQLGEIIVSASKMEERVKETGSSVTVITREEIEKMKYTTVMEALKGKMGISIASSGPLGGLSSVFLRGAESGHTLVMMDGARMYDAITANANFNLAHLTLDNIERIEVIKGPQSSLYGSDAMGGIINIITNKGKGKPTFFLNGEVASKSTYTQIIGAQGSAGRFNYSVDISNLTSNGVSKARDGDENDEYEKSSINTRMSYNVSDNLQIGLQAQYLYAKFDLDDGGFDDDANNRMKYDNSRVSLFTDHRINDIWDQRLQYSWMRIVRQNFDDPDSVDTTEFNPRSWFKGWLQEVDWQHNVDMAEFLTLGENVEELLTFGFQFNHENGQEKSTTGGTPMSRTHTEGYYVQNKLGLNDKLFWTLAFRADDHSRFGAHTTGRSSLSYLFDTQTRLKGSYGTGFNAPSLFQLFSAFGDGTLDPEKSWGYDVGLEQELFDQKIFLSAVFFFQRFENLIEFDFSIPNPASPFGGGMYINRGAARTKGLETEMHYRPTENLMIKYGFTMMQARDLERHFHLVRRPNLKHSLTLDLGFWEDFHWTVEATRNLKSFEAFTFGSTPTRLKDYTVVNTAVTYQPREDLELYLKVENVFDETYQEVNGFTNQPRFYRFGTKFRF